MLGKIILSLALISNPITVFIAQKMFDSTDSNINQVIVSAQSSIPARPLPQSSKAFKYSSTALYQGFLADADTTFLPIRNWNYANPQFSAKSILAVDVDSPMKVLYSKSADEKMPIASLTKLATALVVLEYVDLNTEINISETAVAQEGSNGLEAGQKILARDLLYVLLVESSNDASAAFDEYFAMRNLNLVDLMNRKVKSLGMTSTVFDDYSGLSKNNISTANDVFKLANYAFKNAVIAAITSTETIDIPIIDSDLKMHLNSTNKLFKKIPNILAAKTGYTAEAGECMILMTTSISGEKIIYILLGSQDRFGEMENFYNWTNKAFIW